MNAVQTVDLTNCDREPIHIPGSIQPHGALLALDVRVSHVLRHSANAPAMLGLENLTLGALVDDVLGAALAHAVRNSLAIANDAGRPALMFDQLLPSGVRCDIAIHRHLADVIVEFEPCSAAAEQPMQVARTLVSRISELDSVHDLVRKAARLVRGTLGYDRVMIYQFEANGAGKVVAEAKRGDLESFLGQYFPATDIPQQARALYLKNILRVIGDASFQPVPIVPARDLSGEPLDLTFAHLRSVSPIHCEYLRNMGVAASMSVSIIVDGALWGLIACHHYSPKILPMPLRVATEMFGEFMSLTLSSLRQRRKLETGRTVRAQIDRIQQMAGGAELAEVLGEHLPNLGALLPNDGFGLYLNGRWTGFGSTPPASAISGLANFLGNVSQGRIWASHDLANRYPAAEDFGQQAAGVLAIPLSQLPGDFLFFFRKEMVQTLNWAGNPDKAYQTGPMGDRLTPRTSFAIWKQTVERQSQPWSDDDREIAESIRGTIVEVVLRHNELMADERSKAEVRQNMLNQELNHRVKNILAVIKSLVGQPLQEGRSLRDYVETLKKRIQALAVAHDQVIRGDGGGKLAELLSAELGPYRTQSNTVSIEGPQTWMDSRAFSVMALVLHELATNAAKYGALSAPGGHLDVRWHINEGGDCVVDWRESGGPIVVPPSRTGFGTALLDRSVPYELGGESVVDYASGGVVARFRIPARHLRFDVQSTPVEMQVAPLTPAAGASGLPDGLRIMLVEDQMLIAMDVETMFSERGFDDLTTCNSVADAMRQLDRQAPDVAVLDVNLGVGTSIPVAERLSAMGVPFVFATGYGDGGILPASMEHVPVVRKPYDIDGLLGAMAKAIAIP